MAFGNTLKSLILEKGITQKELAKQLDIAPSTLGNYVRNFREPDYNTLVRLAKFFNVSTDYLLYNESPDHTTISRELDELEHIYTSLDTYERTLLINFGKTLLLTKNGIHT